MTRMAAELFSSSLPQSGEVEVKKTFIQTSQPELPPGNHIYGDTVQTNTDSGDDGEERDGWQEAQPTLRERSAHTLL